MSQIKLLLDVVADMRHLADSLAEYANAVTGNEHLACEKPAEQINPADFEPIYDPAMDEQVQEKLGDKEQEPQIPLREQVMEKLTKLTRSNRKAEARALIQKYGGQKFTELPETVYPEMLKELEAML